MSDQGVEFFSNIEDQKTDYPSLGWMVNKECGRVLDGNVMLSALVNWKGEIEIRNKTRRRITARLPQPPRAWTEYIQSLIQVKQQRVIIESLRAAERVGLVNIEEIRKKPEAELANMVQNNGQKMGQEKAAFLKNAFSIPLGM